MISQQLVLETDKVLLRPMHGGDLTTFRELAKDTALWTYFTLELDKLEQLEAWMEVAMHDRVHGSRIPFTIIEKASDTIAGSSSYGNISYFDKRIEIGWSWLGKQFQGTGINLHAKFCLLNYAFQEWNFERVELKTDNLNDRAKQGLRKIGAQEEGVLRSHMQMPNGRRRDSVYFSILKTEWPAVRDSIFKDIKTFSYSIHELS